MERAPAPRSLGPTFSLKILALFSRLAYPYTRYNVPRPMPPPRPPVSAPPCGHLTSLHNLQLEVSYSSFRTNALRLSPP